MCAQPVLLHSFKQASAKWSEYNFRLCVTVSLQHFQWQPWCHALYKHVRPATHSHDKGLVATLKICQPHWLVNKKSRLCPLWMRARPLTPRNDINRDKNLSSLVFDFESLHNTLSMAPSSSSQMLSDGMRESRNNIKKKNAIFESLILWKCDFTELKKTLKWAKCLRTSALMNFADDTIKFCQPTNWMSSRTEHQTPVDDIKQQVKALKTCEGTAVVGCFSLGQSLHVDKASVHPKTAAAVGLHDNLLLILVIYLVFLS